MKPYYEAGEVTLYHAEFADIAPHLGDFDLIFTSPPYNLGASPWPHLGNWKQGDSPDGKSKWRNGSDGSGGVTYADHEDTMPWDEYVAWQRRDLAAMWDHLSDVGAIFYNHKPRPIGGRLWLPFELIPDLPMRQIITWTRSGGMNFNPTHFVPTYEWVIVLAKEAWRLKNKAVSGIGDVWQEPATPSKHPAPFPLGLPARAIDATGPGSILDPFAGSGTTLRAAKNAGVRCVGVEKSERYCEMAVKRLAQEVLAL